ncbi:hypothetical protein E8K88_16555 [Lampropedia aestuarii]|uniref:Uncharacterized protein n=1 Tax=Lampropedia aestuarii TaxID=2562762 RepID=A0A4S5BF83_9BURK|nr:hypothetical protein [Lampropedia aestuarii]THJ30974.1 hypothetical protein E8K88_16555 [Lampropedia aestuarii]
MTKSLKQQRALFQPQLVELIAGLRRHQIEEAVQILLDYIDASTASVQCLPSFESPLVQSIYEILADSDAATPTGEHYEGFTARRIAQTIMQCALLRLPPAPHKMGDVELWPRHVIEECFMAATCGTVDQAQNQRDPEVAIDALILEAWNKHGGGISWGDFYQATLVGIQIGASYSESGK